MKATLVATILATAGASALDIFVDTSGNDNNDGRSSKTSLKTLKGAQSLVRDLVADTVNEDITVHIQGAFVLDKPLHLDHRDSGSNGHAITWQGDNATFSGGLPLSNWSESEGIFSAPIPEGTKSRNLYVNGKAAQYARTLLDDRNDFTYTNDSMTWNMTKYDWIVDSDATEVRFINSFTDRYAIIDHITNRSIVFKQPAWRNQVSGYDSVLSPFADFGVYLQNSRHMLTLGGEHFVGKDKVYYKPRADEDMSKVEAYLGVEEVLVVAGGTYDKPVKGITFKDITFAHTTWNKPSDGSGYVDQQTGGHIGENVTYPEFEASRPRWWMMPSAVQVSAAEGITFQGCTFKQLGGGGLGIGNDNNAHLTEIGLGASNISVVDNYFTQVMGNSITAGGIHEDAHHPSDERMLNSGVSIEKNIFYNVSSLYSSTVPIFLSYSQSSVVAHNDINETPYSGICYGYGWGANDAGGSEEYVARGLYKYQPLFETPTIMKDNRIEGNLIQNHGWSHTDLGGMYTLSKSPNTHLTHNFIYQGNFYGIYNDEASSEYIQTFNVLFSRDKYYTANLGSAGRELNTGHNTIADNWGYFAPNHYIAHRPDGTGEAGSTFLRNTLAREVSDISATGQKIAWRAGIPPAEREDRPVSNDVRLGDAYLDIIVQDGKLALNVSNFDDVDLTNLSFNVEGEGISVEDEPAVVPADESVLAFYGLKSEGSISVSASLTYDNPRMGWTRTLEAKALVKV